MCFPKRVFTMIKDMNMESIHQVFGESSLVHNVV